MDISRRFRPERAKQRRKLHCRDEFLFPSCILFVVVADVPLVRTGFVRGNARLTSSSLATWVMIDDKSISFDVLFMMERARERARARVENTCVQMEEIDKKEEDDDDDELTVARRMIKEDLIKRHKIFQQKLIDDNQEIYIWKKIFSVVVTIYKEEQHITLTHWKRVEKRSNFILNTRTSLANYFINVCLNLMNDVIPSMIDVRIPSSFPVNSRIDPSDLYRHN